jgi:hypothetical protein
MSDALAFASATAEIERQMDVTQRRSLFPDFLAGDKLLL